MSLFQQGVFRLAQGQHSLWKIECDALTKDDWAALAMIAVDLFGRPGLVEGVPRGGLPFAEALRAHAHFSGRLWIVDDVLTTGGTMERHRAGRDAVGVVVFARYEPRQPWIRAIFTMPAR